MFISWSQYYYFEFSCYQCITDYLSLSSLDCQDKYYMPKTLTHLLVTPPYPVGDCLKQVWMYSTKDFFFFFWGGGGVLRPIE